MAEVLARYRWSHPRTQGDNDVLPRQLKDTVLRALSGKMLSRATLALFIGAFGFTDAEADRLRRLAAGSSRISVLAGPRAMRPDLIAEVADIFGPPNYQTVSLADHVSVGAEGLVTRARTLKVIEATADGVDRIPFIHDTDAVTLEVGQGCQGISGKPRQLRKHVFATDILLAKELSLGETLTLEYWNYLSLPRRADGRAQARVPPGRDEARGEFRHPGGVPPRHAFRGRSGGRCGTAWTVTSSTRKPSGWTASIRCTGT